MATQRVWTADELTALAPSERQAMFDELGSSDIADVPEPMLEAARDAVRSHIEQIESVES